MYDPPRIFVSYSHDDPVHKDWVLTLATRLVANGVDVLLDQWDLTLGSDLPRFMETGLTSVRRVLAICSGRYVQKSNDGQGGVGYEKMILTGQLMDDPGGDRIIPVIRNNPAESPLPTFLSTRRYIDFRENATFEPRYAELLREIHGRQVTPRPPLGPNPFATGLLEFEPRVSFAAERYISPALSGTVTFDYSNNNGRFVLGAGDMLFETAWSGGSTNAIHVYTDAPSVRTVALATGVIDIQEISDASTYDTSSRVRSPKRSEVVVWQNVAGYFLATRVEALQSRSYGSASDEITFSYAIAPNKSADFTSARRTTSSEFV